ncbi:MULTISPECIES: molybdenum cofactor guanylyltransferase MobA [unclassified Herbaspirillum]|jgi:molybdopterin-guanine dinucleotide biosynthesis protein A|uniref:molybdenum cofactor guanylyltransferase MobA n=1 Tax=unclassified Herbaspirillum TaxID=2624150 RepID=UPI000E2E4A2D|nr:MULTISPECIES: molybdenum cofactor guanylyltransferase MobA [unclassified Herbaspirillum]RFB68878.1 molybdenum cofactor guanylyltransferase MobA [Herbaspirillum sp. 3R-3a1]TFI05784.1 molybdenum cofactor guanylyltransferase MobA [Herbaspirillum sp. 3R11]TFI13305.1 molybdenum cofactor guanylyltransferase MobA [Herbaspirillum sp. 3R-11]TFI28773.1 molybdenum cofactor guanylyltransferase MobA [Herbaspirillum sp. 3C11]
MAMAVAAAIPPEQITGLVLAGGRGARMGHVDKGLQLFRGKPLAMHVMERLAVQTGTLAINANRHQSDYAAFNLPVWPDLLPDFPGPLAGLHSGLTHCATDYLVSAPCDSPLLPPDLVTQLAAALIGQQADAAIAVTGSAGQANLQRHPVFCLLRKTLLPSLTDYLQQDGRKMERWFAGIRTAEVRFDDEAAFSNINTLQELRQLESE